MLYQRLSRTLHLRLIMFIDDLTNFLLIPSTRLVMNNPNDSKSSYTMECHHQTDCVYCPNHQFCSTVGTTTISYDAYQILLEFYPELLI
jgi:hypothetical protein